MSINLTSAEWILIGLLLLGVSIVIGTIKLVDRVRGDPFAEYQRAEMARIDVWPLSVPDNELPPVLYMDDGIYLLMPRADLQGDDPVKIDAAVLGPRDESGRFATIPKLDTVLRAATYVKPTGDDNGTQS